MSAHERALQQVVMVQLMRHNFEAAHAAIQKIATPHSLFFAKSQLIRNLAEAGRIGDAEKALIELKPGTVDEQEAADELRRLINVCRNDNRADAAIDFVGVAHRDALRSGCRELFSDIVLEGDSIDEKERKADSLTEPYERTSAWQQIAWSHWQAGNRDRTRSSIEKALQSVQHLPKRFGYQRVLLADLCAEMGDMESALRLLPNSTTSDGAAMLNELNLNFGLRNALAVPLLIGVYTRAGNVDAAVAIAKEDDDAWSWMALAYFGAQNNELDVVETLLESLEHDSTKAILCAGVALGLKEMDD
jgi:hypothetical protein